MNARKGAAALLAAAAAASTSPAGAQSVRGSADTARAGLPLVIPKPLGARVVVDTPAQFREALGDRADEAYAYADTGDMTVHIPRGAGRDRFAIAHEKAHLLDEQMLTDAQRKRFQRVMRAPAGEWDAPEEHGPAGASPRGSAGEWFADYYAAAVTNLPLGGRKGRAGVTRGGYVNSYADLGPRRLRRFRVLLDEVARARAFQPPTA